MGGKETVRGILFQAFVCCQEMFNKKWSLVKFEPTYHLDDEKVIEKVDILFTDNSKQRHALQVKSSINKFGEADIRLWIQQLKSDIDADFYELHLVGECKDSAKGYVDTVNKSKDTMIYFTPFNINNIENNILNKAKIFLSEKNIGSDNKRLESNIKIICFELLKNALDEQPFSFVNIMDMLTSTDDEDLKDFCELIRDRMAKRIDLIFDFYRSTHALFGFGSETSRKELKNNIKNISDINSHYELKISEALKNVEEKERYYAFLCREYLESEDRSIKVFLNDLNTPQDYYHQRYSLTYHLHLRNEINKLVNMYNGIDVKISNKFFLTTNQKELFENQDDIFIQYNDIGTLEEELKKLAFKEQEYPRIMVFTDDNRIGTTLAKIIEGNRVIYNINGNVSQEDMFKRIVLENEAFTQDGSFSPQLYVRYIVFVLDVSAHIKRLLEEFKSRSTIKYIFIEKNDCHQNSI